MPLGSSGEKRSLATTHSMIDFYTMPTKKDYWQENENNQTDVIDHILRSPLHSVLYFIYYRGDTAHLKRCFPRLVNILRRELPKDRNILADKVSIFIRLLPEGHGAVAPEVLRVRMINGKSDYISILSVGDALAS